VLFAAAGFGIPEVAVGCSEDKFSNTTASPPLFLEASATLVVVSSLSPPFHPFFFGIFIFEVYLRHPFVKDSFSLPPV